MQVKKITVLYNSVDEVRTGVERDKLAEDSNFRSASDVSKSLTDLGYEVTLFDLNYKTIKFLSNLKTDLIFNLTEGFGDLPNSFAQILTYLETLGLPITGSSSYSAYLAFDKARVKEIMIKNKIPTPNYQLFTSDYEPLKYSLRYPIITKPCMSHASQGITQDAVVKNYNELKDRIRFIKETYHDATLAEEYIDGKELDIYAVRVGDSIQKFPILEAVFLPDGTRKWDICDFDHKWGEKSYCDEICPADISELSRSTIFSLVEQVFESFDIRGYARLDIRLSKEGIPYVVDLNMNPGLEISPGSSNITNIRVGGYTYDQFIQLIVDSALLDFEQKSSFHQPFLKKTNLVES